MDPVIYDGFEILLLYTDDKALLWESADYQGEIQRAGALYEGSYGFKKIWTCNESGLFYGEWKNLVMDRQ